MLYSGDQVGETLHNLFNPPGLSSSIEYDCFGPQSLDDDIFHVDLSHEQWHKVKDVYETDHTQSDHLPNSGYVDQYPRIDVIYRVTGEAISFKNIRPSQLAAQQGSLEWGDRPKLLNLLRKCSSTR